MGGKTHIQWACLSIFLTAMTFSCLGQAATCHEALSSGNWLQQIRLGNDKGAAQTLGKIAEKMPKYSAHDYVNLLWATTKSLEAGCDECSEEAKVTLFRGISLGRSDMNALKQKRPLFPAKLLMSNDRKNLQSKNIGRYKNTHVSELMSLQARQYWKQTPFLSTSYSPWIAGVSQTILVLRICPQRLLISTNPGNTDEFEVLVPFFIHPNELYAAIESETQEGLTRGKFDIVYSQNNPKNLNKLKDEIQEEAQSNEKMVRSGRPSTFANRLEKLLRQKIKADQKKASGNDRLLEDAVANGFPDKPVYNFRDKDSDEWTKKEWRMFWKDQGFTDKEIDEVQ